MQILIEKTPFENLYSKHIDSLKAFSYSLTKNTMEAEDLVQETVIKLFKNFEKFRKGTSFKNWSFTIMKNTFITKYNRRKRRQNVSLSIEDMMFAVESHVTAEPIGETAMSAQYILDCMEKLSPKSRETFVMHIEGYKYDEIAESKDIPIGTVKSRINFARQKLQEMISSAWEDAGWN